VRIAIPDFAAPDSFADNVSHTLRAMGHEVWTLPPIPNRLAAAPAVRIVREAASRVIPNRPRFEERWLLIAARRFRPHVVLALTQSLSDDTLVTLKRLGVGARVAWWGDTPANMRGMGLLSDAWDHIFLKDTDAVMKFRRVGLNAELLHEAMNPSWHHPMADREHDRLAVAGSFYGYRQILVLRLMQHGVAVDLYGGRLPRWVAPEIAQRHTGRFIVREDKSRVFGAALGCLNSTSLSEGNSLNCRAFEVAGAGGLQFLEYRPALEQCFDPGRELLAFHTFEQLLELIQWAKRDRAGAQAVRRAGAARALAEHTYRHRLTRILDCVR
jgi:spore maturation protein CgeB